MIDYDKEIKKLNLKIEELENERVVDLFKDKYVIVNHLYWRNKDGKIAFKNNEYFKKPELTEKTGEYIYNSNIFDEQTFNMYSQDSFNDYLFTKEEAEEFANNSPFPDIIKRSTFLATDYKNLTDRIWAFNGGSDEND